jgi:hypothetical protein
MTPDNFAQAMTLGAVSFVALTIGAFCLSQWIENRRHKARLDRLAMPKVRVVIEGPAG